MRIHPLNLIRIYIRCIRFHRRRQVNDHGILFRRPPFLLYGCTDLERIIQLCTGKAFRRIFQYDPAREFGSMPFHHLRSFHRNLCDLLPLHMEDHIPLQCGSRIVNMHNRLFTSLDRLKCPLHQFLPALGQYLYDHIVRNHLTVDQLPQKIKFYLAGRRKSNLYLLESQLDQIIKEFYLLRYDHRVDQRLITVAQIHAAPDRCFPDLPVWPLSLRIIYHRIFTIVLVI